MARTFDGTQYLQYTTSAVLTVEPITMACWFNVTNDLTNGNTLICLDRCGSNGFFRLACNGTIANDPIVAHKQSTGGTAGISKINNYPTLSWHHGAAVFNATNKRTVYLDGTPGTTNTSSISAASPTKTRIGATCSSSGSPIQLTIGSIANVGIWNVVLTGDEILSLASGLACSFVRPDALIAWYPLFNSDGDVDWWSQYNMTAVASPTYTDDPGIIMPSGPQILKYGNTPISSPINYFSALMKRKFYKRAIYRR